MNFSLYLQTICTFTRQNKATSKEANKPHTDKNWTSHLLGLERDNFAITSAEVSWEHSPCTYTYIHLKGHDIVRCC